MASETLKALLMIAMFGLFEAILNLPQRAQLRRSLHRAIDRLWHALPLPHHGPELVPVRNKRRKG